MLNGIVNVYKPSGVSSNYVVINVKKILNIKKVGHTGTLDPLACGVLPICIGNATKLSEYLLDKDKVYFVKIKFGILTDTYDCEGKILQEDKNFKSNEDQIKETIKSFVGEYDQIPPIYSALKVNGRRAYDLAREGEVFELKHRKVKIYFIENILVEGDECSFVVKCSKGTYIRSLCKDIGDRLNTFGTMIFLERIESGIFTKDNSVDFESLNIELIERNLILMDEAINFKKLKIRDEKFLRLLINGVAIKNPAYIDEIENGIYFFYDGNKLKGICERKSKFLKTIKLLN